MTNLRAENNTSLDDTAQSERLLNINEVAMLTGLSAGTLYHFVSQKRIPVVRISQRCIRFRRSDLLSWIEALSESSR